MTMESSPDKENKQDSVNLDDSGYRSPISSVGSPSPNKPSPLSRSAGALALRSSFSKAKLNLSSSCFADLCGAKEVNEGNDDLTSLSWLQENNLLKAITSSPTSAPLSPTRENKRLRSYQHTSFKDTVFWTSDDYAGEEEIDFVPKGDNQNCKPPYSFSSLIFMAIENSPSKCLPVKDIYSWIVEHFPYFRNAPLGWKNSVRHNLSLNKSFRKIEKDKNGVGKGSLWCIDTECRPNLLHALRKTPAYNSMPFSTPPTSPGGSFNGGSGFHSNETRLPGVHSPSFDDAEFDAAATMCTISTPPELRDQERERLRNRASTPAERSSPALLNYWRKYIEPFSDDESGSSRGGSPTHESKENDGYFSSSARFNIEHLLADVGLRYSRRSLKRSADGVELHRLKCNSGAFLDEGVDSEYDFNNRSDEDIDDDSSDDEISDNLRRLVERDTLGDSGYGGDLGASALICDHTYVKVPKMTVKEDPVDFVNDRSRNLPFSEVDALLSLANAATQQLEEIKNRDS